MSREPGPPRAWALTGVTVLLAVSFAALFRLHRLGPLDFWWWLGLNVFLAAVLCFAADRNYAARLRADIETGLARKAGLGLASAALLYGLFAAGRLVVLKLFPFAASGIAAVYGLKSGAGMGRIALLLGLLIGPGEEIVWRGFLQENLGRRMGRAGGFALAALVYALVHVTSGNVMLVLAAGACGVFWGLLYRAFRSPIINIVSHTAWVLAIFVIWPF